MKYTFIPVDFWEELKTATGGLPCNIMDSGKEVLLDFGANLLTPDQEAALIKLMAEKPFFRGKRAKLKEKVLSLGS